MLACLACTTLLLAAPAFTQDPPAGRGLPTQQILDQLVTYSDGYRTRLDLRFPDPVLAPPGPNGWPVILFVHSWNDSRMGGFIGRALQYASQGYVTLAYDVRGHGDTVALNPGRGMTFNGPLERGDMVELFHFAEALLGPTMDFDRLAVRGKSQGAQHAWAAAAMSGKLLPQPRGRYRQFPVIAAISEGGMSPAAFEVGVPGGNSFSTRTITKWFEERPVFDPPFETAGQAAFLAQDFAAWAALIGDAWRGPDLTRLQTSTTAVFAHNAWYDWWAAENTMVDALQSLPATTPWLAHISTGKHGSPLNQLEDDTWWDLERRWFGHVLKGIPDELTAQPRFRLSRMPEDTAVYMSNKSVWPQQIVASYPAAGQQPRMQYLRAGGALSDAPPAGPEARETVQHVVAPGYGPQQWLDDQICRGPFVPTCIASQVFASIPLSRVEYRSAPLATDQELLGRTRVTLELDTVAPNLQIHVALFDEQAGGARRWVTDGFAIERGRGPGASRVAIEMGGASYLFRAGNRYVLEVENHLYRRPPGRADLHTAPFFESYTFDLVHDGTRPSAIALPLLPVPRFSARAASLALSRAGGGRVSLMLDGTAGRAGDVYAALIGQSGTVPGFPLFGVPVPLNWDPLTTFGLSQAGTVVFPGFVGQLDAGGLGQAAFDVTPGLLPAAMVGTRLSFAALAFGPGGAVAASASNEVWVEN